MREQEGRLLAMQEEAHRLTETLETEKLGRLQREQTIEELNKKMKSLESKQHLLKLTLREKEEREAVGDEKVKHLKQKSHKLSEKVVPPMYCDIHVS